MQDPTLVNQQLLNQYFTPRWAAEAIVDRHFSKLREGATVIEPSCGNGRFLMALPDSLNAIGVEIDPVQAQLAREATGRTILTGSYLDVDLPQEVDAVIGNPPFVADTIAAFLDRSHELLRDGGQCGFILPAYVLQTSSKVMSFARKWSISTELMPRNMFPGLSLPITFTLFTKDRACRLTGFFLYRETADVANLRPEVRKLVAQAVGSGSVWRQAVNAAFDCMGEEASEGLPLSDIYAAVEHRPAHNSHVHEQVRKVLQTYPEFVPVERGVWARSATKTAKADENRVLEAA